MRFDPDHDWKVFSISNGTSRTFFYTASGVDYRAAAGWQSNSPVAASLMTHRETPAEVSPGKWLRVEG
jgi:hypothetical protein